MEALLIYILKVNIALAVSYVLYVLMFRKDTFIKLRRFYFLSAILFSFIYPLYTVDALSSVLELNVTRQTQVNFLIGNISSKVVDNEADTSSIFNWKVLLLLISLSGTIVLFVRLYREIRSLFRLKSRSVKTIINGVEILYLSEEITPFSYFKWIFINIDTYNEEELKQIIWHEQTHVNQLHSIDVMISELVRIFFWWNPIVWFMKREITISLEYLADNSVLEHGADSKKYQYHLLRLTYHKTAVEIVNNFNVSQLKQRIMMMNKSKTPYGAVIKYLVILPIVLLMVTVNSTATAGNDNRGSRIETDEPINQVPPQKDESPIYEVVEQLPSFPGGQSALMDYFKKNLKYPVIAIENGIQGRVIIQFIVEKDGSISSAKYIRGVDPSLDKEAMRIVNAMPKWVPGKQKGESVRCFITIPIEFRIPKKETKVQTANDSII